MKTYKHTDGKMYQLVPVQKTGPNFSECSCSGCDLNPNNLHVIDATYNCKCNGTNNTYKICSSINNEGTDMILKEIKNEQPKKHIRKNMITIVAADAVYKIDKDLEIESTYAVYKDYDFGGSFSSFESAFNLVQELLKLHDEKAFLFYTQKWLEQNN